ncbi:Os02g0616450 [Oryza sativa Japonica Group]|uniref:Os02g0616450 protein n=1 Tax=Oryza sativa subsp. japonica TaxID=39947 RepID=A0A0N7KFP3_ORYSJ|nr:Os02g0616450 [Oryza sativa Japonica Group]
MVGPTWTPHVILSPSSSLNPLSLSSRWSRASGGRQKRETGRAERLAGEAGRATADGGLGQVRGTWGHRAQTAATAGVVEKGVNGIVGSISSGHASFPFSPLPP